MFKTHYIILKLKHQNYRQKHIFHALEGTKTRESALYCFRVLHDSVHIKEYNAYMAHLNIKTQIYIYTVCTFRL